MLKSAAVTTALLLALAASPAPAAAHTGASVMTVSVAAKVAPMNFWCAFLRIC